MARFIPREKVFTKNWFRSYLYIVVGTLLSGKGLYGGKEKTVLMTVLNRRELTILIQHVKAIDPEAFVTVVGANKILGKGFKSLSDFDTE